MNEKKVLKIGCHNVGGLSTKLCEDDYVDFMYEHDIFCAQETFTHENFDFSLLFTEYETFHNPAVKLKEKGRRSGGLVVFIRKSLMKFISHIQCDSTNLIAFLVDKRLLGQDANIMMIFTYVHPYRSPFYDDKEYDCSLLCLEDFIVKTSEKYANIYHMVVGDLNSRIGSWNLCEDEDTNSLMCSGETNTHGVRHSNDPLINTFGKNLINLCEICKFVPLNGNTSGDRDGKFTFVTNQGQSVIDLAFVSAELYQKNICCFHVQTRVESIHSPIYIAMYGKTQQRQKGYKPTPQTISSIKWNNQKSQGFRSEVVRNMTDFKRADSLIETNPDEAVKVFSTTLVKSASCMRRTIKIRTGRHRQKNDWYDNECVSLKQAAQEAKSVYDLKQDDKENEKKYLRLRSEYKTITRTKRRISKTEKLNKLIQEKNNGEKFWGTIKALRKTYSTPPDIDIEVWEDHFENVFKENKLVKRSDLATQTKRKYIYEEDLDKRISQDEVRESIRALKSGKAGGLDEVCGEFLKNAEEIAVPFMTKLFNNLYDKSYFPIDWCKAVIVPILKKGSATNPDNYRGISLLSIVSKVFTSIINKRLYNWCEIHKKLSFEQAAFRKTFSTTDHIFTLSTIIRSKLCGQNSGKVYACFVDYHKAYDQVDRQSLWNVLIETGISNKIIALFKAIYSSVLSCVKWNGTLSNFFLCSSGLRQGCLCSPLAFALLIGKVADYVRENGKHGFQLIPGGPEIYQLLFADDIVLLSSTPHGLQKQIDNLETASNSLGLTVNMNKTKVMVFRNGGFLGRYEKWTYKTTQLEVVNKYKYLGYTLTTKLSETLACEEYIGKAKGKVFEILKTLWALGSMNTIIFFQLFDAQVKPMLLYAAEIWGVKEVNNIESAHMFACKRLLSLSDRTPNQMIYGETGRHPILIDAKLAAVRYWLKVMKMPESRLPKQALLSMKMKYERDRFDKRTGWYAGIHKCITDHGFTSIWENGGTSNESEFLKELKGAMVTQFKWEWQTKIYNSDRYMFYRTFKTFWYPEPYLNDITVKKVPSYALEWD